MGLFSKKDACPVCGGEVKGMFLVKFGGKQTLCKDCSKQVSMSKNLLETATPEFMKEHLDYRRKNAEKYATHNWTVIIKRIRGLMFGLDEAGKAIYLIHDELHDNEENPVVFSFDQITGYELYRNKKKLDDMENTDDVPLSTAGQAAASVIQIVGGNGSNWETFHLKLTTTDPYWKEISLKINFTPNELYGIGGIGKDVQQVCRYIKSIIRNEPLVDAR